MFFKFRNPEMTFKFGRDTDFHQQFFDQKNSFCPTSQVLLSILEDILPFLNSHTFITFSVEVGDSRTFPSSRSETTLSAPKKRNRGF